MKVHYISARYYEAIMPYGEFLIEKKRDTVSYDLCAHIRYLEEQLMLTESQLKETRKQLEKCPCRDESDFQGGMGARNG